MSFNTRSEGEIVTEEGGDRKGEVWESQEESCWCLFGQEGVEAQEDRTLRWVCTRRIELSHLMGWIVVKLGRGQTLAEICEGNT